MDKKYILKHYFGYDNFRSGQGEVIDSILARRDALAIMPTGGGKSLCYQIPALLFDNVTLVISPLISLMKDQVAALKDAGISAAYVNSSLSEMQLKMVYERMREGKYKIVYVAPERLEGDGFTALVRKMRPSLIAVDEAHCISQWGQDFRPSYLKIADFIARLDARPVVAAFTATATSRVREDIVKILQLDDPFCIVTGFDRPNLQFDVISPKNKTTAVKRLVEERRGKSGIIYCATRAKTENVCDSLNEMGIPTTRYHAGLPDEERRQNQDDFQNDRKKVMVATNAFGMGIDKSNVGFVIHYNMPKSLEAYYQEAGRAGRDGEKAECILLYAAGDVSTAKYMIQNSADNDNLSFEGRANIIQEDYRRLDEMIGYCKTTKCLRSYILRYFGQECSVACGNCGNCHSTYTMLDITTPAQMIISCVKRARDFLGYGVGATMIISILRGSQNNRITQMKLDTLSTFGLMKETSSARLREYIDYLVLKEYLKTDSAYNTLDLTKKASEILFDKQKIEMPFKAEPEISNRETRKKHSVDELVGVHSDLFELLKSLRYQIAQEERVPAYIIFSNASLAAMATKQPQTLAEFLDIPGVGEMKASRYGERFIEAITDFIAGEG